MGACNTNSNISQPAKAGEDGSGRREPEQLTVPTGTCNAKGPISQLAKAGGDGSGRREPELLTGPHFVFNNPNKVRDVYSMDENKIGKGSYGVVRKGVHKSTNTVRAIKQLDRMQGVNKHKREVEIMKTLDHPNIITLFEIFENRKYHHRYVYLAMELCSGGELLDRIIEAGHFEERDAAGVLQQVLRAVFYLHRHTIAHRDLKPQNCLFLTRDPLDKSLLKVVDFGVASRFTPGEPMKTSVGTPDYIAPEVMTSTYDCACDLWSVGVMMFVLLCGYPPFNGRNDKEVLSKVSEGAFSFDDKDWGHVSTAAKELIRLHLSLNPRERPTAEEALEKDWIKQNAPRANHTALEANPRLLDNLRTFHSENKLKKAALHIIAGHLDETQIRGLRETWTALDENNDGSLTLSELKTGLEKAGLRRGSLDLEGIVESMDTDGSGVVDYTEFIAAALDKRSYLSEQACWTAFRVFDLDGDGRISLAELRQVLERDGASSVSADDAVATLLRSVDTDGNGMIDFQEFMGMMRGDESSPTAKSFDNDLLNKSTSPSGNKSSSPIRSRVGGS